MENLLSKIFRKLRRDSKPTVFKSKRGLGQSECSVCGNYVSSFIGGTRDEVSFRQCLDCCKKENDLHEYRYENDDKKNQTIEYNAYRDEKQISSIKIGYFTDSQVSLIEAAKEQIYKELSANGKR